jgi:hypothetical protein
MATSKSKVKGQSQELTLSELPARLEQFGFFDKYLLLGDGNLRHWDWNRVKDLLPEDLAVLWTFFLCGQKVRRSKLRRLLPESLLEELAQRGICYLLQDHCSLKEYSLISYNGHPVFVDRSLCSQAYFGEESKALLTLLPARCEGGVLVLNAGCGIEGIAAARRGAHPVTLVSNEFNPAVVEANLLLNGIQEGIGVYRYKELSEKPAAPYQFVLANGVGYIQASGVKLPAAIAGGLDGHNRMAQTLQVARDYLAAHGRLGLAVLFYSDYRNPVMHRHWDQWMTRYELDYDVSVASKFRLEPGVPVFNQLLAAATAQNKKKASHLVDQLMGHLASQQVDAAYLVKGICKRSIGTSGKRITDFSETYYGTWTF